MDSINRIKEVFKPVRLNTLEFIKLFLFRELSSHYGYHIKDLNKKFSNVYGDSERNFTRYLVRIHFPFENIFLTCSLHIARQLPVIGPLLKEEFNDQIIDCNFYDPILKIKCIGPKLIILTLPMSSIILENGKSLLEMI